MTEHTELESAALRALDCVKAKGFQDVEVNVGENPDGSLAVYWGYADDPDGDVIELAIQECEAEHLVAVQQAHEAPFLEADAGRYRKLAEKLETAGLDLGDWDDENLSSALSAALKQDRSTYMRCFREVFPDAGN